MKKILFGFLIAIGITAFAGSFTDVIPGQRILSATFNQIQQTIDGILDIEIPTGKNTYTARIQNDDGSVSLISSDVPWVDTTSLISQGRVILNFNSLGLLNPPAVIAVVEHHIPTGSFVSVNSTTNTSTSFSVYDHAGGAPDRDIIVYITRQGDDYNLPMTIRQKLINSGLTFLEE